ncbi:Rad3-related DNA helicase [Paenibacillus cellulosilyticus]|uniref:Rad3-related DNA helicase n=1 Tax=Paenibacillus cellulosilyticus TaxID=375489 RepID=A0A2V2YT15_9BACL|nr:ATP-dependent DNA helicase [Paenibacillus cellulosilyticus]PWW02472.1 Rad3-related DNA helicase [Paenibacillus cellulosilyticus]QKS47177.1 ATP-dependent DNA helicase [Paenibacillus cellulosilyticus]
MEQEQVHNLPSVQLSVRQLVEYAYRSGDIVSGFRSAAALAEGTRIHQAIQIEYGPQDVKEYELKTELDYEGIRFLIEGRCDGLLHTDDGMMIDEIKSMSGMLPENGEEAPVVHWAQAICYAYIYGLDHQLDEMRVRLTYVSSTTGERRAFVRVLNRSRLLDTVMDAVRLYAPYARLMAQHTERKLESAKALVFPFPEYRAGQRKFAAAVYQAVTGGAKLFAKAPTGIGKTISTLFPAVKAIGEERLSHLFYLTAKTITRVAAEDAFRLMQAGGLHMHVVTLTAKDKICFQEEVRCSKEHCPFAEGYYDRINEALLDMLGHETIMTRAVIEQYARKHRVCPFEMSLDAAYASDAIIGDYNYIFDPRISLKRMFEERKKQTAVLVDEAHNLVDRGREMYSAALNKDAYLQLTRAYKGVNTGLHKAAKAVNDWLLELRKSLSSDGNGARVDAIEELRSGDLFSENKADASDDASAAKENAPVSWTSLGNGQAVSLGMPADLIGRVESFAEEAAQELASSSGGAASAVAPEAAALLLDAYYAAQQLARIAKLYDERYITIVEHWKSEVRLKLFCLDPSHLLRQAGKGFRAHIFFSATLSPMPYYIDLLGGDNEQDYSVSVPSPFTHEQLEVKIMPLSTRYRDRDRSYQPIARALYDLVSKQAGNSLVFFPSYEYMNQVYEPFMSLLAVEPPPLPVRTIVQTGVMSEEEREAFLASFRVGRTEALVGFAVMGGIFSEGVDLAGDRLTAVAVVGVGLPQVGLERDMIREYCERSERNGFDYAYVYPGMNKVLQAGGRLIRSEHDRGRLLLIDDRYLAQPYNRLLPTEWRNYTVIRANSLV